MQKKRKEVKDSLSPGQLVWKRLRKNGLAVFGMVIIFFSILVALLGYLIMPDSTPNANEMSLALTHKKPGFSVLTLKIRKNEEEKNTSWISRMFWGEDSKFQTLPITSFEIRRDQLVYTEYTGSENKKGPEKSLGMADVVYALHLENPEIRELNGKISFLNFNGERIETTLRDLQDKIILDQIVKKKFFLGTDRFGRDMLSRLLAGTRVSLSVGLISVVISLFIGLTLGSLAGYFRGKTDTVILWFINVVWSIPTLLLVIAITLALGKGFWQVFVAVGLTMWVDVARIARGQIFSVRELDYIEAGRAFGYSHFRLILKHILPNISGPLIVVCAANFASAILLEAGLSFLGVGAQPPIPSWGMMIKENYGYIIVDSAHLALLPGIAILIMVLAFYLLGNGLRDAFDAKETMSELA